MHSAPLVRFSLTRPPLSGIVVFFASDRAGLLPHGACAGIRDHLHGIVGGGFCLFRRLQSGGAVGESFWRSPNPALKLASLSTINI